MVSGGARAAGKSGRLSAPFKSSEMGAILFDGENYSTLHRIGYRCNVRSGLGIDRIRSRNHTVVSPARKEGTDATPTGYTRSRSS